MAVLSSRGGFGGSSVPMKDGELISNNESSKALSAIRLYSYPNVLHTIQTNKLPSIMDSQAASSLELEIRRQTAIDNYAWARRTFRRSNKTESDSLKIVLGGISHSKYRRHFGHWDAVDQPLLKHIPSGEQLGVADRAQAHRHIARAKKDPYFVNRDFGGRVISRRKRKRGPSSAWGRRLPKRKDTSKTKKPVAKDTIIWREEREVALWRNPEQLIRWLDFGRFQTSRFGAFDNCKVYGAGSIVFVCRVKASYVHHWHCPKVVLEFDTAKLARDQTKNNINKLLLHNPWDREEEFWSVYM